ncbi:MAG TPA: cell wall hydrolase [Sphingomicrobium sp.]|nr:cell wall hydrolase [Sphingomicrobium sp.]
MPAWNKPVTSVAHDSIEAARGIASINTLPPPNLLKPLSPVQAAQINAERPFTDRPDVPASRFLLRTDAVNRERAITCLAQAVYYEAAGEGLDGERAVAQVVLNRVRHPGFPSTICGVVYQGAEKTTGCQFSFTCDGSMQRIPAPALWTRSRQIADEALKGRVFAAVGHATHYHADYVLPYWADSLDKSVRVGRHIFYRLPRTFGDAAAFSQRYGGIEQALVKPSSTIVLPPAVSTEQLATALLTDGVQDSTRDAEKASPQASSSLLIDATRGALLADGSGTAVSARSHRTKASSECSLQPENGKVVPLGATVMRSTVGGATCQGQ